MEVRKCSKLFTKVFISFDIIHTTLEYLLPAAEKHPEYDLTLGIDTSNLPKTKSKI
jgi:hypothetical protein